MSNFYSFLTSQFSNQGSKSNIVKPLLYVLIALLLASFGFLYRNMNTIGYILLSGAGLILLAFLFTYFYCLFKNPDLLRSEKYNLEKTAIEKTAIYGDSQMPNRIQPSKLDYVVFNDQKEIE